MAYQLGLVTGIVVGLLVVVVLLKKRVVDLHFDERQELARGKAFQYAFFTLMVCVLALGCTDWFDTLTCGMLSICIAVTVFAVIAIWKDAYLSLYEKPRTVMTLFAAIAAVNLLLGICWALRGELVADGRLTFRITNLFVTVMLLTVMAVYGVRCLTRQEEADE